MTPSPSLAAIFRTSGHGTSVTEVIYSEPGMQTGVRQPWYPGWVLQMGTKYLNLLGIFLGSSEGPVGGIYAQVCTAVLKTCGSLLYGRRNSIRELYHLYRSEVTTIATQKTNVWMLILANIWSPGLQRQTEHYTHQAWECRMMCKEHCLRSYQNC